MTKTAKGIEKVKRGKLVPLRLAEKLRAIRLAHNLSQAKMLVIINPDESDSNRARVSQYESRQRIPSIVELYNYALFAGVSMEELVDDERDLPPLSQMPFSVAERDENGVDESNTPSRRKNAANVPKTAEIDEPISSPISKSNESDGAAAESVTPDSQNENEIDRSESDELEFLRTKLKELYPANASYFPELIESAEEISYLRETLVVPAFERIRAELATANFNAVIRRHQLVTRFEIRDGIGEYALTVRVKKPHAAAIIKAEYLDHSVIADGAKKAVIYERTVAIAEGADRLTAEQLIRVFNETFFDRRQLLKEILERDARDTAERRGIEAEKEALRREERRAKLIELKRHNQHFDPYDEFKKILDSKEHKMIHDWVDRLREEEQDYRHSDPPRDESGDKPKDPPEESQE